MGGIIIIVSILVPVLLLGRIRNVYLILMVITTIWLGFLGLMDDYIKIFRRNKEGLKGKYKIVGQVSIGFIVGLVLYLSPDVVMRENISVPQQENKTEIVKHESEAHKSLKTTIPFTKHHNLSYSEIMSFVGKHKVAAGWILFVIMTIIVVTAVSNGANLNDGMDGMCAGNSAIVGVALGILAYVIVALCKGNGVQGWASLMLSVWLCSGCVLIGIGIVGEYVGKIYMEVKHRPRYNIKDERL